MLNLNCIAGRTRQVNSASRTGGTLTTFLACILVWMTAKLWTSGDMVVVDGVV